MKKFCSILLVFMILSLFAGCGAPDKKTDEKKDENSSTETVTETDTTKKADFPAPRAASAIVIDANSGDVLYSLDAEKKLYPANTVNIMTAIVALENASLGDPLIVQGGAVANAKYDHTDLRIKEGETYTVEQLLYPTLLTSVNDAAPYANTLAMGLTGSIEAFVEKMNQKAKDLDLKNTKFTNPSGIHDEEQYTTTADLAKLARYAMQNITIQEIVKTPVYSFGSKKVYNTNHLVSKYIQADFFYNKAIGIKASNSEKAGHCLVAAAKNDELSLITVVMGCEDVPGKKEDAYSFIDTVKMCEYVFENYKSVLLIKKGHHLDSAKVSNAKDTARVAFTVDEDVYMTLENTADVDAISRDIEITEEVKAPIRHGDRFGTVTYSYNGQTKTVDVVAASDVKVDRVASFFGAIFGFIFNPIVIILIILIVAAWIRMKIVRERKRKLRRRRLVSRNGESGSANGVKSSHSRSFTGLDRKKRK